jgi:hypothetical protein
MGAQLGPQIGGEQVVAIDGCRARCDFVGREGPHGRAQHVYRFAMGKTEARGFHVCRSLREAYEALSFLPCTVLGFVHGRRLKCSSSDQV